MYHGHCTLHADVAGYLDGLTEEVQDLVRNVDDEDVEQQRQLHLVGWAFHWRWAARPVRYCRRLQQSTALTDNKDAADNDNDDETKVFRFPLTMLPRPDVYDFYERYAVLLCGWDQRIPLPATTGTTSAAAPVEHWLELQLRDGQWVKFLDLASGDV